MITVNKRNIISLVVVLLVILFAFGGWILTRALLEAKEAELFSQKAKIRLSVPEIETLDYTPPQEDPSVSPEFLENLILNVPESDFKKILGYEEGDAYQYPHDPTGDMLSMNEAIEIAYLELVEIFEDGWILSENLINVDSFDPSLYRMIPSGSSVDDMLGMEPYYSFWNVRASGSGCKAIVLVNAHTSDIWRIYLYDDEAVVPHGSSSEFLAYYRDKAGLEPQGDIFSGDTSYVEIADDLYLCCQITSCQITVDGDLANIDGDLADKDVDFKADFPSLSTEFMGSDVFVWFSSTKPLSSSDESLSDSG